MITATPASELRALPARPVRARRSALAARPRIRLAGGLTALAAPGGGETQLWALTEALAAEGWDARPWRPWEESWEGWDILHLVGSRPEFVALAEAARARGKRVVVSPVAWFDWRSAWGEGRSWSACLRALAVEGARRAWPGCPTWRGRLYRAADCLLPNSQAEAEQLVRLFAVPRGRIRVVPNGARPGWADARPEPFRQHVGLERFVLYAGRIEPRKNQLGFLRAMRGSGLPCVILGDPVPGFERYAAACRAAADHDTHFVPRLASDDPLLASAFAAARCLALVSWFETPGLAALEAALWGTPLVLTPLGATVEYFGRLARYAHPRDSRGIRREVEAACDAERSAELAAHVSAAFTWPRVAQATGEVYASLQ